MVAAANQLSGISGGTVNAPPPPAVRRFGATVTINGGALSLRGHQRYTAQAVTATTVNYGGGSHLLHQLDRFGHGHVHAINSQVPLPLARPTRKAP